MRRQPALLMALASADASPSSWIIEAGLPGIVSSIYPRRDLGISSLVARKWVFIVGRIGSLSAAGELWNRERPAP